ncbi:MAG: hypothetical protein RL266_2164 [Bacteroidota bacterium]|jgi:hypothetical protein
MKAFLTSILLLVAYALQAQTFENFLPTPIAGHQIIAYTHSDPRLLPLLKLTLIAERADVSSRILFGTDFYMTEQEASEREHSIRLRTFLGEELFKKISETNQLDFLNLN